MTGNYARLRLYDFASGKWEDLLNARSSYPDWTHDGKCIYYSDTFDKSLSVFRMCFCDRKPVQIANLTAAGNIALGRFGSWTGIGPDDSILVIRDIREEEIYALETKLL